MVASAMDLQASLSPFTAERADNVVVERGFLLEPLSFLPTLTVQQPLRICGASRSVRLRALEEFSMLELNSTVTWCDISFDLTFQGPDPESRMESLMFDLKTFGRLEYEHVDFSVGKELFTRLLTTVEDAWAGRGSGRRDIRAEINPESIKVEFAVLGQAVLRDVLVRLQRSTAPDPVEKAVANEAGGFDRILEASQVNNIPLEMTLERRFMVTRCVMDDFTGGELISVNRLLTLVPGSPKENGLAFADDVEAGFMQVENQVRFDGVSLDNRAQTLELALDATGAVDCDAGTCIKDDANASAPVAVVRGAALVYKRETAGCRLVMRNATIYHSCEFVKGFAASTLYQRNPIFFAPGELYLHPRGLREMEIVNDKTLEFRRFMGWGLCLENTLMTCEEAPKANLVVPRCISDPKDREYYEYEGAKTASKGPDLGPKSQDPRSQSSGGPAVSSLAIILVVLGSTVAIGLCMVYVCWNKLLRCMGLSKKKRYKDLEMAPVMGDKQGGDRAARPPGGKTPRTGGTPRYGGEFLSMMEGKRHKVHRGGPDAEPELTRASLIHAISAHTSGIEDCAATIESQIAAGGNGVVYKGTWKGITVAIKTVIFQDAMDSANRQRQRAVFEAAISSSVAHKNIVQTYAYSFKRLESLDMAAVEVGSEFRSGKHENIVMSSVNNSQVMVDWKLYIVQEFCEGGSLRDCLDEKRLLDAGGQPRLDILCEIGRGVASGMDHLHTQHNIVHGDLSTKNILLKRDPSDPPGSPGTAKIADFGLSIKMGVLQSHISNHCAGTPFYMAPEVCQQGWMSKKADVFSFGVFMWELYHSKKCYHMADKSGLQYHPLFPKFPITCPIPYAMLCVVCISPDPQNRPDFSFVARALAALQKQINSGAFLNVHDLRIRNMQLAAGLGRMTAGTIMDLIAERVGIPVTEPSVASGSGQLDRNVSVTSRGKSGSVASRGSEDVQDGVNTPRSMYLPTSYECTDEQYVQEDPHSSGCGVHLSQAFVAPFHCVVSVGVTPEHNPAAPVGFEEQFAVSWQCDSGTGPPWQRAASEEGTSREGEEDGGSQRWPTTEARRAGRRSGGGGKGSRFADLSSGGWPGSQAYDSNPGSIYARETQTHWAGNTYSSNVPKLFEGNVDDSSQRIVPRSGAGTRSGNTHRGVARGPKRNSGSSNASHGPRDVPVDMDIQAAFAYQRALNDREVDSLQCSNSQSGLLNRSD